MKHIRILTGPLYDYDVFEWEDGSNPSLVSIRIQGTDIEAALVCKPPNNAYGVYITSFERGILASRSAELPQAKDQRHRCIA